MDRPHRATVCARQLILHTPHTADRWDRLRPRGIGDLNNARRGAPQMRSSAEVGGAVVSATEAAGVDTAAKRSWWLVPACRTL